MISTQVMLQKVKDALRVSSTALEPELNDLITSAQLDLGVAGVIVPDEFDALVSTAIIAYCKANFGNPQDADRWKRSYDEQKSQLTTNSNYTEWTVNTNV